MCQSVFFDNVNPCTSAASLKTRLQHRCFLVNFAKFVRTSFSQNTTRRLLLIIAVSIVLVMKGGLASETVNNDTKTVHIFESQVYLLRRTLQVKQQVSEAVLRRPQTSVFKNFVNFTGKHLCLSLLVFNSIKKRLQYRCFL